MSASASADVKMRLFLEDHELSREIREILHVLENFGLHISDR
jgi:hypothetical protein